MLLIFVFYLILSRYHKYYKQILRRDMNQDDQRFFRENFSADSLSDLDDNDTPQATYEKSTLKFKIPSLPKKESIHIIRKQRVSQDTQNHSQESHKPKSQAKLSLKRINTNKEVQLKMLEKFKAEIEGIKHLDVGSIKNSNRQDFEQLNIQQHSEDIKNIGHKKQNSSLIQKSRSIQIQFANENNPNKLSNQHRPQKQQKFSHNSNGFVEERGAKQTTPIYRDGKYFEDSRISQMQQSFKKEENRLISRVTELEAIVRDKDNLIKRLRKNQEELQQKYQNQIRSLQNQAEKLQNTVTGIRKQLLEREYEVNQLRQKLRKAPTDSSTYKFQRQIELLRSKQKQYLQTIRSYQTNNPNYSFNYVPQSQMQKQSHSVILQLSRLRETLKQKDQQWAFKISEAIEQQRKNNMQEIQRIVKTQRASQTNHSVAEERIENIDGLQLVSALDRLVREIQELKRTRNVNSPLSFFQQLRFIRQFIIKLQRGVGSNQVYNDEGNQDRNFTMMLQQQLENYKRFVKQQQINKKAFLDQLNLYKQQNQDVIKQNAYLRGQLGQMESNFTKPVGASTMNVNENDEYRISVQSNEKEMVQMKQTIYKYQMQLQEQDRYIKQLQNQMVNNEPQKPIILHPPTHLEGVQEAAQLNLQIDRLNNLLQTQIAHLTQIGNQKARSYEQQIKMYQERIQIYEQSLLNTQSQINSYEAQIQQLSLMRTNGDTNLSSLIQVNKQFQQESMHLKAQLGSLVNSNRQLQTQIKERSHAVDHLWQVKQAEFDNVASIINRVKINVQI